MPSDLTAPSAWRIEQAVSAYQRLRERIAADPRLADDEALLLTTLDGEPTDHPLALLDRVLNGFAVAKLRSEEADAMRRAWKARHDRYAERQGHLRKVALDLMEICGERKRTAQLARAHVRDLDPAVVILDETKLGDRFVNVEVIRHPKEDEIAVALLDGEVVEGAVMSNPSRGITITRLARPLAVGEAEYGP